MKTATEVLHKLVTDDLTKIRWGLVQREQIRSLMEAGQKPTGYRMDWLNETVASLNKFLCEKAAEFNVRYPQDRISAHDLIDVLGSLLARMQQVTGG